MESALSDGSKGVEVTLTPEDGNRPIFKKIFFWFFE
jgi:hypothetical protein